MDAMKLLLKLKDIDNSTESISFIQESISEIVKISVNRYKKKSICFNLLPTRNLRNQIIQIYKLKLKGETNATKTIPTRSC